MTSPFFSLVDLVQGSADWQAWRRGGIGASDAPAIMGENPWKSAKTLAREKIHRQGGNFTNAAMTLGNDLEPVARDLFAAATGVAVAPACLQSTTRPWMRASVDGICTSAPRVVEIKCGKSAYAHTEKSGTPPHYYIGQLQHIMAVTGYASIDFCCYMPGRQMLHFPVPRDEAYITRMIETEQKFWTMVQEGLAMMAR